MSGRQEPTSFGYVVATRTVLDGRAKVRFMYHQHPFDGLDSGWRFTAGEDETFLNNPANLALRGIGSILAVDPSVEPYLASPVGTAWWREGDDGPYLLVGDFVDEERP